MAILQNTGITGSLEFAGSGTFRNSYTENTSSVGYVWFDLNSNTLKVSCCQEAIPESLSYTATAASNVAKGSGAAAGTQNSAVLFAGLGPPFSPPGWNKVTEEYNGTSWSTTSNHSTQGYGLVGAGTQNAALKAGGATPGGTNSTEEYNGTSWSGGGSLSGGTCYQGGSGTQNDAISVGGRTSPTLTQEYNGSSWSSGGTLPVGKYHSCSVGPTSAAKAAGGLPSTFCVLDYDGNSWSTQPNTIFEHRANHSMTGTQNAASAIAGVPSPTHTGRLCVERYDGISWSATTSLLGCGNGSQAAGATDTCFMTVGRLETYNTGTNTEESTFIASVPALITTGSISFT